MTTETEIDEVAAEEFVNTKETESFYKAEVSVEPEITEAKANTLDIDSTSEKPVTQGPAVTPAELVTETEIVEASKEPVTTEAVESSEDSHVSAESDISVTKGEELEVDSSFQEQTLQEPSEVTSQLASDGIAESSVEAFEVDSTSEMTITQPPSETYSEFDTVKEAENVSEHVLDIFNSSELIYDKNQENEYFKLVPLEVVEVSEYDAFERLEYSEVKESLQAETSVDSMSSSYGKVSPANFLSGSENCSDFEFVENHCDDSVGVKETIIKTLAEDNVSNETLKTIEIMIKGETWANDRVYLF